jgi:hypothetical protein
LRVLLAHLSGVPRQPEQLSGSYPAGARTPERNDTILQQRGYIAAGRAHIAMKLPYSPNMEASGNVLGKELSGCSGWLEQDCGSAWLLA